MGYVSAAFYLFFFFLGYMVNLNLNIVIFRCFVFLLLLFSFSVRTLLKKSAAVGTGEFYSAVVVKHECSAIYLHLFSPLPPPQSAGAPSGLTVIKGLKRILAAW